MQGKIIIPDQIKECIAARLQGDIPAEQDMILREWLESDMVNKRFFEQLQIIWEAAPKSSSQQFDVDKAWKELEEYLAKTSRPQKYEYHPYLKLYRKLKPVLKIVALLVLVYILGIATAWWINKTSDSNTLYVEMTAPKGSRAFLSLDDGTKVWLNAGTSLKYPKNYGQQARNVSLSGEAYFEVAKNKDVPFVVNANGVNITALGTSFNVKAYVEDGQVETTLTEGSVRIEQGDGQTDMKPIILRPNQKAVLKVGVVQDIFEKSETIASGPAYELDPEHELSPGSIPENEKIADVVELYDTRPYTSWKDPRWVFKQQNLAELATKLERRYDVHFIFKDEHLKDYVISGTLLDETLEQVMNTLRLTAPIDYVIDHKTVTLKENPELKKKYQRLIK